MLTHSCEFSINAIVFNVLDHQIWNINGSRSDSDCFGPEIIESFFCLVVLELILEKMYICSCPKMKIPFKISQHLKTI